MPRANGATSKVFPLTRGNFSIKWKSPMSISSKVSHQRSPSSNEAPELIRDRPSRPRPRFTIICASSFQRSVNRTIRSQGGRLSGKRRSSKTTRPFEGLVPQMQRLYAETQSEFTRNRIRAFMTREPCKVCGGARLKPEILAVTLKDRHARELNIHQISEQTIEVAGRYVENLVLSEQQRLIVNEVVHEIQSRLQFLVEVGLGYLTLNRESGTLSGGEAQRIRLATQIGSGLAGVLYVLDEPSIGLHQRDNGQLLGTLHRLRDLGNSVIVVEHDEETIRAADHIIDLGPGAGPRGGEIVAQGKLED